MATIVNGHLPLDAFALSETFATIPDLRVEGAPVGAAGKMTTMPLLWAQTDDDDLTATLAQDPTVTAVEELRRTGNRRFYRMEWTPEVHCCMNILLQSQGLLLQSQATSSQWRVDILYPDREVLRQANESCERFGLSLTIDAIRSLDADQRTQWGLTSVQYRTLTRACQQGYFQVPREIALDELAGQIGISHQALSERLRRGHDTLINATLSGTDPVLSTDPPVTSSL